MVAVDQYQIAIIEQHALAEWRQRLSNIYPPVPAPFLKMNSCLQLLGCCGSFMRRIRKSNLPFW
jgi:hypothetical protein